MSTDSETPDDSWKPRRRTAGDRARARIRRNRLELESLALAGAFGPIGTVDDEETIEDFAAKVGLTVAEVLAAEKAPPGALSFDELEESYWASSESARDLAATLQRFAEGAVDRALPAPKRRAGLPEALRAKLEGAQRLNR